MRFLIIIYLLFQTAVSSGQRTSLFEDFKFDSTYSLAAISSSFSKPTEDSKEYCFYVDDLVELNTIKKDWTVKSMVPRLSLEEYSISIYVIHDRNVVSSDLLIYPRQEIIHYKNHWYDFDIKKFKKIQTEHPLNYHSQIISFIDYMDYSFFRDSVQNVSDFLFLFEPTAKKFEGYFNLISSRSKNPIFISSDINEELKDEFPTEKFEVGNVINDSFNLDNNRKVKTRVNCSKTLYDKYKSKWREKDDWVPSTYDAKVFIKN